MQLGASSTAKRKTIYSVIAGSILFLLSLVLIPETLPASSSATSGVVPTPSLTMSGSHTLNLSVNPGQFGTTDAQNLVIATTNYTGYNLSIAPSTGESTDLVNAADNTVTLPTVAADSISASDFASLSTAAYALSTDDGASYKKITNGGELYVTNTATDSTTGGLTIKLGAKAISSTPSGTYTKTFTLTAVANPAMYSITYDKNTEAPVYNFPTTAETTVSGININIPNKTPTRPGYKFLHWNTVADNTGASYNAGGVIPLDPETQNTIILYAIWGCGDGYICYDDNGATAGQGTMLQTAMQSSDYNAGASVTLVAPNYSKTGYAFVGWSETQVDPDAANVKAQISAMAQANPKTIYGPNETITMPNPLAPKQLYAVWLPAEKDANNQPVYLQGWTGCSSPSMHDGDIVALTDNRDDNVYAVAKIEKNVGETDEYSKCWLIENLRLDVATTNITDANTNHPTSNFKQEASTLSSAFWDTCTSNDSACFDHISYSLNNINGINAASYDGGSLSSPWYSYGGMYNWYTTTAGNGTYNKGSGSVSGDICPAGWHLPTGGSVSASTEFNALYTAIGGTGEAAASQRWRSFPNNFVHSGRYSGTAAFNRGSVGEYWSSTAYDSYRTYSMYITNSAISHGTTVNITKQIGFAVRCLAGDTENFTLTYSENGGDAGTVPSQQTATANGISAFTLSDTVPTRSGYTFVSWVDEEGVEAAPGDQYITANTTVTLYARWTNNACNPTATTIGTGNSTDAKCLQDVNAAVKSTMPTATSSTGTYTLIDARDNKTYTIAKLDDGEIWMTKNLALEGNNDVRLTSYDTDLKSGTTFTLPATTSTTNTSNTAATTRTTNSSGNTNNGVYYSWAAAIADTTSYSTSDQNITTSVCPAGWDLPTYVQFAKLASTASFSSTKRPTSSPYRFLTNGKFTSGATFYPSSFSSEIADFLWTSTNNNSSTAHGAIVRTSGITFSSATGVTDGGNKYYRKNLRCIASNGTATIQYDANGGAGTMGNQNNVEVNSVKVLNNSFVAPTNMSFKKWCTNADGSGTCVNPGNPISRVASSGQTVTLYAIWENHLTINYSNNGGSGTTVAQTVVAGENITLKDSNTFTAPNANKQFREWNTAADGSGTTYAASSTFTGPANISNGDSITLYAQWDDIYTITFINTVDNSTKSRSVIAGQATNAVPDTDFARENYMVAGWKTDPSNTSMAYSYNQTFTPSSDLTLYTVWESATVLDTGENINVKLKKLAGNTDATSTSVDASIKEFRRATSNDLPAGFTCDANTNTDNVISISGSAKPICIFFDNANDAGIMYYYSEEEHIYANAKSRDAFYNFRALSSAPGISNWNTSRVTNMGSMFDLAGYSASTFSLDLSSWDTSKVTNMNSMFNYAGYSATAWSIGDLSGWNTASVTNMGLMFSNAGSNVATTWSVSGLPNWNTSSAKNMYRMFYYAGYRATTWSIGDLSSWDTSNVTDMTSMFGAAGRSATTWSVSGFANWDTSKVTSMDGMFFYAGSSVATFSFDLSNWNTSKVTDMDTMFEGAGSDATTFSLNLSGWNTSSVTSMTDMFDSAGSDATTWTVIIAPTNGNGINNDTTHLYGKTSSKYASPDGGRTFTINNANNNNGQQQSAEPQSTPSAAPSNQNAFFSAPTSMGSTNAEDQTENDNDSEATNTTPLGVKRSSDDGANVAETIATTKPATMDESDVFGLIALIGAGVAAASGILLLAGKRRKEDEDESGPEL